MNNWAYLVKWKENEFRVGKKKNTMIFFSILTGFDTFPQQSLNETSHLSSAATRCFQHTSFNYCTASKVHTSNR